MIFPHDDYDDHEDDWEFDEVVVFEQDDWEYLPYYGDYLSPLRSQLSD